MTHVLNNKACKKYKLKSNKKFVSVQFISLVYLHLPPWFSIIHCSWDFSEYLCQPISVKVISCFVNLNWLSSISEIEQRNSCCPISIIISNERTILHLWHRHFINVFIAKTGLPTIALPVKIVKNICFYSFLTSQGIVAYSND